MQISDKWEADLDHASHHGYADWPVYTIRDSVTNVCLAVVGEVDHYDSEHIPERAALMAAAPALKAALERLLGTPALNMDDLEEEDRDAYRQAEEALAQARPATHKEGWKA
jgi:hypothetical protein